MRINLSAVDTYVPHIPAESWDDAGAFSHLKV